MVTNETANEQLLFQALQHYGRVEVSGPESDDWIKKIINEMIPWPDDSTIAWCSIFMNYIAKNICAERTDELTARSWLKVGETVTNPMPGDVVIFWRESISSWKGHVGIYCNDRNGKIYVLGGNQNNGVNIREYSAKRVLGFRRLRIINEVEKLE